MRILVVSATALEVAPLARRLQELTRHQVDLLITGVGMVATAARCARALAGVPYDLALNVGICGSFDPAFVPGTVVHVVTDRLAELGAEDGEAFVTVDELGLTGGAPDPPSGAEFVNTAPPPNDVLGRLPAVRGITVNTVHGHDASIADVVRRFRPQVESMEGAAFMYACLLAGVPFAQVRAVSNMVERRNRAAWKIADAVANLNATALAMLETS